MFDYFYVEKIQQQEPSDEKDEKIKTGRPKLEDSKNFRAKIKYDPTKRYYRQEDRVGDNILLKHPSIMTSKEYNDQELNKKIREYYKNKTDALDGKKEEARESRNRLLPIFRVNSELFEEIFGGEEIDITFDGSVTAGIVLAYQYIENPILSEQNRGNFNTDLQLRISANADGKIGTKLKFNINYDTQATFTFQNQMNLGFTGKEDDIIKKLEIGNVSMPLNSNIMRGSQALFGVKTVMQFGNTFITGIFSQQQSESRILNTNTNGSKEEFEVYAADYEENKHFFLSQYFYENYDKALKNSPYINSQVNITKIEVWVTNRNTTAENTRNIVGFMDIGEVNPYNTGLSQMNGDDLPKNEANKLNPQNIPQSARNLTMVEGTLSGMGMGKSIDFIVLENARLLKENEYTLHPKLGYLSLNQLLTPDQVIIVSFQYTYNGNTYQVGEFSTDGIEAPKNLYGKLLKSDVLYVGLPTWKLMMKNIYNIGAVGASEDDFRLNVLYFDDEKGMPLNYLREDNNPLKDEILLKVFNFDKLNKNGDPQPDGDGYFDFIEDINIRTQSGCIMFPTVEPFGSFLENKLQSDPVLRDKYVYRKLYDSTKFSAKQEQRLNKFLLKGTFKRTGISGSEKGVIMLGSMNVPKGSVKITSSGRELNEGIDYVVDYKIGQVKIINEALISTNAPIEVSSENTNTFGMQTKTFMGINVDQKLTDNLSVSGTLMNLNERPLTQKTNIGSEPVNNTVLGAGIQYKDNAPYMTKVANFLLPYRTFDQESNISFKAEIAKLVAGSPGSFKIAGEVAAYIDDFEGVQYFIDIKGFSGWFLASSPDKSNSSNMNNNRALMSWYSIDPLFYNNNATTPTHVTNNKDLISSNNTRQIKIREIYPQTDIPEGNIDVINTLDIAYFPGERGPYNYNSSILNDNGEFIDNNPQDKWAGIMRGITVSNFEESNVELLQFWVMDPFSEPEEQNHQGFKLIFNIGNVSEDVLKDGRKSYENGLPEDGNIFDQNVEETIDNNGNAIALVPKDRQNLTNAFNESSKANQDLGLEGMNDDTERDKFSSFVSNFSMDSKIALDPSGDNYFYYRSSIHDNNQAGIVERYKRFSMPEGNSSGITMPPEPYPVSSRNNPDTEDINGDQTLNTTESYYEYELDINRNTLDVNSNRYITDIIESKIEAPNGKIKDVKWYQFKIPVNYPTRKIGGISDLRSARFIRTYITNSKDPIVLRFAELKLVRSEWRKYNKDFKSVDEEQNQTNNNTRFELGAVSIEENSNRQPINYHIPPGIERQESYSNTSVIRQNEQSMSLSICDLEPQDSRSVFKDTKFDFRRYEKVKMFVHLEGTDRNIDIADGELSLFIRIGGDLNLNYYEYEVPLKSTSFNSTMVKEIWPEENNMDLDLKILQNIKLERDKALKNGTISSSREIYTISDGKNKVHIKGYPNYSSVKNIMIGVKNNSNKNQCFEVWVNELRLVGMDNRGGWASYGQLNANLSNLLDFSIVGQTSSSGYGGIDMSNSQRSIEDLKKYDFATTVNLGMLVPENEILKLNFPFFYNREEIFKTPLYNPLRPDTQMDKSIENMDDSERNELLNISQDYTRRTNVNISGFRIETPGDKSFYSISNFTVSYSDNQLFSRNIDTEFFLERQRSGNFIYSYSPNVKPVEPFKESIQNEYLTLIKNFNFNYLPSNIVFKIEGTRDYTEEKFRNLDDNVDIRMPINYIKKFTLNYEYGLNFDLTKNIRLNYKAGRNNIIDEPQGAITQNVRDSIWKNVLSFGRPTIFNQIFGVSYKIPFDEIPFTKFLSSDVNYNTTYQWKASSLINQNIEKDDGGVANLGNKIQNSGVLIINSKMDFKKIYSYIENLFENDKEKLEIASSGRNNIMEQIKRRSEQNASNTNKKDNTFNSIIKNLGIHTKNLLFLLKDIDFTYSLNRATSLPGFIPSSGYFGMDNSAPTIGFLFGDQTDIRYEAVRRGWLTPDAIILNDMFTKTKDEKLSFRATLEPINRLRINVTANKTHTYNSKENYEVFYDQNAPDNSYFESLTPVKGGAFSISFISLNTLFDNQDELFRKFIDNTKIAADAKSEGYYGNNIPIDTNGYPVGFGKVHSEVLITSFLNTYGGGSRRNTNIFRNIPLPNWNVTYNGFMDLDFMKKIFKNFSLNHAYSSTYAISSFQNDLNYAEGKIAENGNFISQYTYGNITIIERLTPLLGFNMTLKNNFSMRGDYKKDRALSLSLNNNGLNEIKGDEYLLGFGYVFKDIQFTIETDTRRIKIKSDINFKIDFSYKQNKTLMRKIVEEDFQVTAGDRIMNIRSSADYKFTKNLIMTAFFEYSYRKYEISTSFPTFTTRGGVNVRFNLE